MVNKAWFGISCGVLCFAIALSTSASALQKKHSFSDLEKLVMEQDYVVASLTEQVYALQSKRAATNAQYLPKFNTNYRFFGDGFNLAQEDFGSKHFLSLRISQDLIKLFKVRPHKLDGVNAELDILRFQLQNSRKLAVLEFRKNYIDVLQNRKRVFYYRKLIQAYEKILKIKRKRYEEQEDLLSDVLQTEKELINVRGLYDYHQIQFDKQKSALAQFFDLQTAEINWDEIRLTHADVDERKLMAVAIENSNDVRVNRAKADVASFKADASYYDNFNLTPFVGLRIRGDRFGDLKTGPEAGIRFSIPLWFRRVRTQKNNQYESQNNAKRLIADNSAMQLQKELLSVLDKYRLLNVHIRNKNEILDMLAEKSRIQRSRHDNGLRDMKLDPVQLMEIDASITAEKLEKNIYEYEQHKSYYELIFLAGMIDPQVFAYQLAKDSAATKKRYNRAIWLWDTAPVLNPKTRKPFTRFCKTNDINKVFLSLNTKIISTVGESSALADFLAHLHDADIKVAALIGEPPWVYEKKRANLIRKLEFILAYNKLAEKNARFDAVHLDIEPHALAEWSDYKSFLLTNLVETVRKSKETLVASLPGLSLEIDIPVFYHKIDKTALETLIETADVITIMAYERKTPQRVLTSIEEITALVGRMNKPFMIGFNAKEFEQEDMLENLLGDVGRKMSLEKTFAGFAIHDYRHYAHLLRRKNAL